jgi:hypothetical protein
LIIYPFFYTDDLRHLSRGRKKTCKKSIFSGTCGLCFIIHVQGIYNEVATCEILICYFEVGGTVKMKILNLAFTISYADLHVNTAQYFKYHMLNILNRLVHISTWAKRSFSVKISKCSY